MTVRGPKPGLLCVVPPYTLGPPAGIAYLLAYLKRHGCHDFAFLDLRLGIPSIQAPTYSHTGVFGESYVMDVPDLPLVLALVQAVENGEEPTARFPLVIGKYCRERGLSAQHLTQYLGSLNRYLEHTASMLNGVRIVGCTVWTSNFLTTLMFAAQLKRLPEPPLVVTGGPQTTESTGAAAIAVRSRLVDCVVMGEGEAAILDVYSSMRSDRSLPSEPLAGTTTLVGGTEVRRGPARRLLPNNDIPLPDFDDIPLLSYQAPGSLRRLPFHLSRGCTDKCTFCSEWVFWERFRPGNAPNTIEGSRELVARYGAQYLAFTDSLLNGHPGRLRTFAEGMLSHGIEVKWGGFMRAEMDAETAVLLRRAGCDTVFIGVESLADETLELMNKRRTEPQNLRALRAFLAAGINVIAGCIPGFPGDTRDAFVHTIRGLAALQAEFRGRLRVNVEPFIVSPGQPLYSRLHEMGLSAVPWDDETQDLAPAYRDITAGLMCAVTGANQGVERSGRLLIAQTLATEEYSARTDPFFYKGDDPLGHFNFTFEYLTAGWFVARIKGPSAWVYALIVDEQERRELLSYERSWNEALVEAPADSPLHRIEQSHTLRPSREPPSLVTGGYLRELEVGTRHRLSRNVIARRVRGGLMVVDFLNAKWSMREARDEAAVVCLAERPFTVAALQDELSIRGAGQTTAALLVLVRDLAELGMIVSETERAAPMETREDAKHTGRAGKRALAVLQQKA